MSGTSLDGVDGVLARFEGSTPTVIAHAGLAFEPGYRAELLALNAPGPDELHRSAVAGNRLSESYAAVVQDLLRQAKAIGLEPGQIAAIGAHGQTVRHHPEGLPHERYSVQLINPALLAELCGLDVVADFRRRDMAAGGQGAPLVPAFHRAVFARAGQCTCVLNLGGIANLSVLPADTHSPILGFDCGPGNVLIDLWCQQQLGQPFDKEGAWAASGSVIAALLAHLLAEPYFAKTPPKSTGRDLFSPDWLANHVAGYANQTAQDIAATLTSLTAHSCANSIQSVASQCQTLIVCGGGAFNRHLLRQLQALLPQVQVSVSDAYGLPAQQVEAAAFAWLARQAVHRQSGNLPDATGAKGERILGAIYPA